jgi:hypothetical protein
MTFPPTWFCTLPSGSSPAGNLTRVRSQLSGSFLGCCSTGVRCMQYTQITFYFARYGTFISANDTDIPRILTTQAGECHRIINAPLSQFHRITSKDSQVSQND